MNALIHPLQGITLEMAPSQLPSRTLPGQTEGEVRRRRPRRYRLEKPRRQLRKRDDEVDSDSEFSDGISSESEDEVVIPPPAQNQGGGVSLQPSPLPAAPFIPALPFIPSPVAPAPAPAPASTSSVPPPPPPPPSSSTLTTQQPPPPPETTSSDIRTLTARPHASVGNPFGGIGLDPNADPALNVQNPQETETETDTDSPTSSPTSVVVVSTPDAVVPSISASVSECPCGKVWEVFMFCGLTAPRRSRQFWKPSGLFPPQRCTLLKRPCPSQTRNLAPSMIRTRSSRPRATPLPSMS